MPKRGIPAEVRRQFDADDEDGKRRGHASAREEAPRGFMCPECLQPFAYDQAELLGTHLERHREVGPGPEYTARGKPLSVKCPKGCGRWFPERPSSEIRQHLDLCDGSPPLGRPK